MSATAVNTHDTSNPISEVDDVNMFQAARRNGRRNALGDVGESLNQVNPPTASAEVDRMMPNFQSMSIKQ